MLGDAVLEADAQDLGHRIRQGVDAEQVDLGRWLGRPANEGPPPGLGVEETGLDQTLDLQGHDAQAQTEAVGEIAGGRRHLSRTELAGVDRITEPGHQGLLALRGLLPGGHAG